jgi:Leucine-rich repeat (LRR) protein
LDLTKNNKLIELGCGGNQLKILNISNLKLLEELNCTYNQLTFLELRNNGKLKYLYCGSNKLNSTDVSKNTVLTTLVYDNNHLTSLDVSKNETLVILSIESNKFSFTALNNIFTMLHDKIIDKESKVIFIADNAGTNNCRQSIAKSKGWRVSKTLINE